MFYFLRILIQWGRARYTGNSTNTEPDVYGYFPIEFTNIPFMITADGITSAGGKRFGLSIVASKVSYTFYLYREDYNTACDIAYIAASN